ncbi:hypothetical protein SAMN05428949_7215 [Chitinophaga sp. YR627]|uniref:hypothetical protein n=1 Tax=Chitinophaga sp. YR627 TaxID=1881041 RepID=UPI0008F41575|nr:hypothetical protein [Chitinophaga sp. YR627]SFP05004.1 hypothetical protein SAMN05428949_7215 [Chitinophaga sp. YR627]
MEAITSEEMGNYVFPKSKFAIDYNMRDYSDDPVFKRKTAKAEATLARCGIPEDFVEYSRRHAHLRQSRNLINPNGDAIL